MSATWSQGTNLVTVTFDRPLQAGASAGGNWSGVADQLPTFRDITFGSPLTVSGSAVSGTSSVGLTPVAGPGRISYAASPPDVISTLGFPAAPFLDFPMTTVA